MLGMSSFTEDQEYTNSVLVNFTTVEDNMEDENFPTHHEYEDFYMVSQFINGLILYPVICFPGLIGNILTLIVLSKPKMRNSTNAFLSALSVSDSIKMINDIVYFSVILMLKTDPESANRAYGYIYPYAHFVFNMSACVSSWLTVSVAVERYILVCHAPRARTMCTRPRAIVTCVMVFVIMTGVALPSAWRYRTVTFLNTETNQTTLGIELTDLWDNKEFVLYYTWVMNFLRCNIPLIVLIIMNACIVNALRKTRANKRSSSRQRITVMMIIVILVFSICITPDAIMSTFFRLGYAEADYLVKGIREFTDTLLALNAAVNFVIYCVFSHKFRQSFAETFCNKTTPKRQKNNEIAEAFYRRLSDQSSIWSHFKRNSFV